MGYVARWGDDDEAVGEVFEFCVGDGLDYGGVDGEGGRHGGCLLLGGRSEFWYAAVHGSLPLHGASYYVVRLLVEIVIDLVIGC